MCNHQFRTIHEEFLLGGHFKIGWQCENCKIFIRVDEGEKLLSEGGHINGINELIGPHGGKSTTSNGTIYKKQILYPDGKLVIE